MRKLVIALSVIPCLAWAGERERLHQQQPTIQHVIELYGSPDKIVGAEEILQADELYAKYGHYVDGSDYDRMTINSRSYAGDVPLPNYHYKRPRTVTGQHLNCELILSAMPNGGQITSRSSSCDCGTNSTMSSRLDALDQWLEGQPVNPDCLIKENS